MRLSQLTKAKTEELGQTFKALLKEDSAKELHLESLAMDTALPYGTITLSSKIPIPNTVSLPFYTIMRINDDIPTGKSREKEIIAAMSPVSPASDKTPNTEHSGVTPK